MPSINIIVFMSLVMIIVIFEFRKLRRYFTGSLGGIWRVMVLGGVKITHLEHQYLSRLYLILGACWNTWEFLITLSDQIPAERNQSGGRHYVLRCTNLLILCGMRKNCLNSGTGDSIYIPVYEKDSETNCSNYRRISVLSTAYKILLFILLSRIIAYS